MVDTQIKDMQTEEGKLSKTQQARLFKKVKLQLDQPRLKEIFQSVQHKRNRVRKGPAISKGGYIQEWI
jgi:hypothetical protein